MSATPRKAWICVCAGLGAIVGLGLPLGGFKAGRLRAEEPAASPVVRLTRSYVPKFFLNYSPDGSHLTYSRHHDNRRASQKILMGVRIVAADGTDDRPLLAEYDSSVQVQEHAAWSPDQKSLLLTGGGNDTANASKDTFICDISPD